MGSNAPGISRVSDLFFAGAVRTTRFAILGEMTENTQSRERPKTGSQLVWACFCLSREGCSRGGEYLIEYTREGPEAEARDSTANECNDSKDLKSCGP